MRHLLNVLIAASLICMAVFLVATTMPENMGLVALTPYAQYPVDYVHFLSLRSSYDDVVNRLPEDGRRYAEFHWDSGGVVYDETDEVALPYGRQSAGWKNASRGTLLPGRFRMLSGDAIH